MTLDKRIEKLERQNRRFKQVGGLMLLFILSGFLVAASKERIVEAQKFVLRDSAGRMRAQLWVEPQRSRSSLALYDEQGKPRALLSESNGAPSLAFLADDGKERVRLGSVGSDPIYWAGLSFLNTSGDPMVSLTTLETPSIFSISTLDLGGPKGNGTARITTGVRENGPSFSLLDKKGRQRVRAAIVKEGAALALFDANGGLSATLMDTKASSVLLFRDGEETRASFGFDRKRNMGTLALHDSEAKERLVISAGTLVFKDDHKRPRIGLGTEKSEGHLLFFDKNGKQRISMGISDSDEGNIPSLSIHDTTEKPRIRLMNAPEKGSLIAITDSLGNLKWGATEAGSLDH